MTRDEMTQFATVAKVFDLYGQQSAQRTTMLLSEKEVKRFQDFIEALERFAALVAAAERDAIYQIAKENCNDEPVNAIITAFMSGQYTMAEYLCERIKARGKK